MNNVNQKPNESKHNKDLSFSLDPRSINIDSFIVTVINNDSGKNVVDSLTTQLKNLAILKIHLKSFSEWGKKRKKCSRKHLFFFMYLRQDMSEQEY